MVSREIQTMTEDNWQNCGFQIYRSLKRKDGTESGKPPLLRSTSFTADTIRKASVQWYKMKWQFTGSANDLWGEEVQGYAVIDANSPLAGPVDFFRSGRVNQIRVRFFNLSRGDDASDDFRCAFLKFGETENEGPLDLSFSTGRVSCFHNTATLQEFLTALDGDEDCTRDWALRMPNNYYALADGIRRYPKCRTALDYHNYATFSVKTGNGNKLVRFRLHGNNDVDSRLSKQEQEEAWIIQRPDMELPSDTYLQQKLRNIAQENLTMKLQVQIRDITDVKSVFDPTTEWEENDFPWCDLADLCLSYSVPKLSTERAKYNFCSLPEHIQMVVPEGTEDYGSLIQIQEKVLTSTTRKKHQEGLTPAGHKETTFLVHVETGNHLFSGTDAGVYIALYGTKGRTKKILLDKLFHNDFERGSKESYYITVPVIGDVKFLQVFLIGGKYTFKREWFLNYIVLMDLTTRKLFEVPVYRWISDKITIPTGEAMLYQKERNTDRKYLRRIWLDERDKLYPWARKEGLPGCIASETYNGLPDELKYSTERQIEKKKILADVLIKLKLHKYTTVFQSFDSFDDFKTMSEVVPSSETSAAIKEDDRWRTDEEFGREFLAGVNPVMIRRYKEPIQKFPVTNDMVGNLLDRGLSLDQEIKAGHIYYVDYPHMAGLPRNGEFFVSDPIVMFYVRDSGQLVPIAIQLSQEPGPKSPIWTPNDSEMDWLLAKMFVKAADSHYQSIYSHLVQTHFLMEAVTVTLHRQLPPNHPVYKLLIQHCTFTVAAGQMGRDLLLNGEDSVFKKILAIPGHEIDLMKNRFKDFTVNELIMPKAMADRGVDDAKLLPNYHFRDDAMLIWNTLSEYVSKIMALFYKSDTDVADDSEMQAFLADLREEGLRKSAGPPNGLPKKITSLPELVEIITMIIFHSSCYHAALNFTQIDYFSFGPNYPSSMRRAPPSKKGETTMQDVIDSLPNKSTQAVSIAFASYLSEPLSDEVYLGEYQDSHFTETEVREILDWFSDEMEKISQSIHKRNIDLDIPYVYLLPERVPKAAGQ
ncbi:polyunsaturated fatty acid 5-lipoxygenase-like isoform X2 [Mercenaria mercenaria]|uniref:polyunsaturated fatty acid 5-lipoxygenase-like isoform X2 n=1 Tax=Mercenaria mercenaria TaxID=6596 RepID=UPI00234E4FCD|nr:polyunsaturated fatty acid 5-lipoxygenase-like isoform X2 [Mercenaria mercenaria]